MDTPEAKQKIALLEGLNVRPKKRVHVNWMSYEDKDGTPREIYLPRGTAETAWDHLMNERWDELAKFETYTDQGYSEEDKMPNEGVDQDAPQEKIPDEVIEQVLAQFAQQEQASAEGSQVQKK